MFPCKKLACVLLSTLLTVCLTDSEYDKDWWRSTIVYQIYPRSFQDSDGNGVGDLKGITSRLDYVKSLGVDTIWLSPIYVSPMADFGYDIADHKTVDPIFGTNEDIEALIDEAHHRDIYIVLDFVPNHTSDKHPWFEASRKSEGPYRDFYRWDDGIKHEDGSRSPPNNWLSIFGGSAWEWDEGRQQYYLHQFLKEQPDLNYREPKVREAMKDVIQFWVDKGVDGFRVDAIHTLFEVEDSSMDEPLSNIPGYMEDQHEYLLHPYTLHQDELHDVIREWRDLLDTFEENTGKHVFMVMEVYSEDISDILKYFHSGANMPFNFGFIPVNKTCGGTCFRDIAKSLMDSLPEGEWPNFVLGNHDNRRITTRKDPKHAEALNVMLLLLPGTPTTYMGEEIGMLDIPTPSKEQTQDPWGMRLGEEYIEKYSRDPCRAPFQWNGDKNAGFSTAEETWLPVHPDFAELNVEIQEDKKDSTLNLYRAASRLRRNKAFSTADMKFTVANDHIFSFLRYNQEDSEEIYMVILNLGDHDSTDNFATEFDSKRFDNGLVTLSNSLENQNVISLLEVNTSPGDFIVIKLLREKQPSDEL